MAQPIPITQNWSNIGLITTDDNWSGVPGIIGYRGDELNTTVGVDPQTVVLDGSTTPIDVNANNPDPTAALSGGAYEFDTIPNPTIGIQGSGTADIPHIVISLNTSGTTALNMHTIFETLIPPTQRSSRLRSSTESGTSETIPICRAGLLPMLQRTEVQHW